MKTVERVILKIILIQIIFLFITQIFLNFGEHVIPLTKLAQYEGVNSHNYTKIMETFKLTSDH